MGRWAQARRRGSTAPAVELLGPPPAPYLADESGELMQRATGLEDIGGQCVLYRSVSGDPPYTEVAREPWGSVVNWTLYGIESGFYYVVKEVGNGTVYAGESEFSVVVLIE